MKELTAAVVVSEVRPGTRRKGITAETIAEKWGIGIETARRTVNATTQRGLRTIQHPSLSHRFRTNDRNLRYRCLPHEMFTDTLTSSIVSKRMNKYAQVFCTRTGWKRAYPMRLKSDAHDALSLMFARDGVPPALILDGSKEQTLGEFRRKAKVSTCHVKTTEPYMLISYGTQPQQDSTQP